MLIKPLISKQREDIVITSISNLPLVPSDSFLTKERQDYLDTHGRLLIQAILACEKSNKHNKNNHSLIYKDHSNWSLCKCEYAKYIRGEDMGMSDEQIERLREVI